MNTKNNKRRRESQNKIETAFSSMLLSKSFNKISVTDICKETGLNRTTFYANYIDIYDLANKIRQNIEKTFSSMFLDKASRTALDFFKAIYDNQNMFKVYFKLVYDTQLYNCKIPSSFYINEAEKNLFEQEYMHYHIVFFQAGINAMIKMWLDNGCKETPAEMADILKAEYTGRSSYFSLFA